MNKRLFVWIGLALLVLACNMGITAPTPTTNLLATLAASTPGGVISTSAYATPTSAFNLATPIPITATPFTPALTSSAVNPPIGKIVFTCQLYKAQASDQICIINADGTDFRRLTTDDNRQHGYPSFAPDGKSVIYAAFAEQNFFDVFEMNIASGVIQQLTNKLGNVNAPEISPDGNFIVFKKWNLNLKMDVMYIMERNGKNVERFSKISGRNPAWSPDGQSILFTSDVDGSPHLYSSFVNGKNLHRVSALGGRSDWSPNGQFIVTDSGGEIYLMNVDGSGARVLSPLNGNAQEPSFSPDGKWIVFSAYYDHTGDANGCEIYILRVDGTDLRRLTDNGYCDYQPRWGP